MRSIKELAQVLDAGESLRELSQDELMLAIQHVFPRIPTGDARAASKRSSGYRQALDVDGVESMVSAYARHRYTDYDKLLAADPSDEGKRKARRAVREKCTALVEQWKPEPKGADEDDW